MVNIVCGFKKSSFVLKTRDHDNGIAMAVHHKGQLKRQVGNFTVIIREHSAHDVRAPVHLKNRVFPIAKFVFGFKPFFKKKFKTNK